MPLKILHENDKLLVVDKPAGIPVWSEGMGHEESIADLLLGQFPELEKLGEERRYGIVHRLDKDTSGILLVAKTKEYFDDVQQQFKSRQVQKKYICLVQGTINQESGVIHTLLGRSPADRRKQKAFPLPAGRQVLEEVGNGKREATTEWKVLQHFQDYTLLEVRPKTGRKHQIRAHMTSMNHPIAGDKLYGFKNQQIPEGLQRHFLHASYIKIQMQDGVMKEFHSELPPDLNQVLDQLKR